MLSTATTTYSLVESDVDHLKSLQLAQVRFVSNECETFVRVKSKLRQLIDECLKVMPSEGEIKSSNDEALLTQINELRKALSIMGENMVQTSLSHQEMSSRLKSLVICLQSIARSIMVAKDSNKTVSSLEGLLEDLRRKAETASKTLEEMKASFRTLNEQRKERRNIYEGVNFYLQGVNNTEEIEEKYKNGLEEILKARTNDNQEVELIKAELLKEQMELAMRKLQIELIDKRLSQLDAAIDYDRTELNKMKRVVSASTDEFADKLKSLQKHRERALEESEMSLIELKNKERELKMKISTQTNTFQSEIITRGIESLSINSLNNYVIFVLDKSGSMMGKKIKALRNSLDTFISILKTPINTKNMISLIEFDTAATVILEPCDVKDVDIKKIFNPNCFRGTCYSDAFEKVDKQLMMTPKGYRPVVIFMTDGEVDGDDLSKTLKIVKSTKEQHENMMLFSVAFDCSDDHLEELSKIANGGSEIMDLADGSKLRLRMSALNSRALGDIFYKIANLLSEEGSASKIKLAALNDMVSCINKNLEDEYIKRREEDEKLKTEMIIRSKESNGLLRLDYESTKRHLEDEMEILQNRITDLEEKVQIERNERQSVLNEVSKFESVICDMNTKVTNYNNQLDIKNRINLEKEKNLEQEFKKVLSECKTLGKKYGMSLGNKLSKVRMYVHEIKNIEDKQALVDHQLILSSLSTIDFVLTLEPQLDHCNTASTSNRDKWEIIQRFYDRTKLEDILELAIPMAYTEVKCERRKMIISGLQNILSEGESLVLLKSQKKELKTLHEKLKKAIHSEFRWTDPKTTSVWTIKDLQLELEELENSSSSDSDSSSEHSEGSNSSSSSSSEKAGKRKEKKTKKSKGKKEEEDARKKEKKEKEKTKKKQIKENEKLLKKATKELENTVELGESTLNLLIEKFRIIVERYTTGNIGEMYFVMEQTLNHVVRPILLISSSVDASIECFDKEERNCLAMTFQKRT